MNELIIQDLFERYLKDHKIIYKREYRLNNSFIDFVIKIEGKLIGVEIKTSYSNLYKTIGQLINFSRFFSHLILVAPKNFIEKINTIIKDSGVLNHIGFIIFENGEFQHLKKPNPPRYYFRGKTLKIKHTCSKKEFNISRFEKKELIFFKKYKNKWFMVSDIVENLKISFPAAYHFISSLRRFGFIKEVERGSHPKCFKFTEELYSFLAKYKDYLNLNSKVLKK